MMITEVKAEKSKGLDLKELWRYRDLLWVMTYREYRVRYAQTFLGFVWALSQPVVLLGIVFFFGRAFDADTAGVPRALFSAVSIAAWTYFAYVMAQSGNSIISSQNMVQKIYFPRLIIPLSKAFVGLIDYGLSLLILVGLMVYYGFLPGAHLVWLPVAVGLGLACALGTGLLISALTIRFRDLQHIVPFAVQVGFLLSPIAYQSSAATKQLPEWAHWSYFFFNPMAGVIESYRLALLGIPLSPHWGWSVVSIGLICTAAVWYFARMERRIADII